MKISMTPYMLNTVDFTEAEMIGEPKYKNGVLEVLCGGITLLNRNFFSDDTGRKSVITDQSEDMYLSGICRFAFYDLLSYSVDYYGGSAPVKRVTFQICGNEAGESYITAVFKDITVYGAEPSDTGYDHIDLSVSSTNMFDLEYDENDLIAVREYCKAPQKHAWHTKLRVSEGAAVTWETQQVKK